MRAVVGAQGGDKSGEAERTSARDAVQSTTVQTPPAEHAPQPEHASMNDAGHSPTGQAPPSDQAAEANPPSPGFGERGRMRRRARFLRKARELAYRDLGGLVFDLHRFGQRNDPLVLAKLGTLREIDTELRGLESGLGDHRPVTVLREVGIAACPRCAAIHGSDDRFCPGCGLAFDANADRPISTAPVAPQGHVAPAAQQPPLAAAPSAALGSTPSAAPTPAPGAGATSPSTSRPTATPNPNSTPAAAPALKPTASPVPAKPAAGGPALPAKQGVSPLPAKPAAGGPALPAKQGVSPAAEPTPPAGASISRPVPGSPRSPRPRAPEPKAPGAAASEDEPTQILRPPRGDADA
jgi:hypothetical protein